MFTQDHGLTAYIPQKGVSKMDLRYLIGWRRCLLLGSYLMTIPKGACEKDGSEICDWLEAVSATMLFGHYFPMATHRLFILH